MAEPTDQDVVDRLERLEAGSAVPALAAEEVRRLGDRRRRRTVAAIAAGAAVAVVAAATPLLLLGGPGGDADSIDPAGPVSNPLEDDVILGEESARLQVVSIPGRFPIEAGFAGESRDVGVNGPVGELRSWATPPDLCGTEVWPVEGEDALSYAEIGPESYRARVLVTYGSVEEATAVVDDARSALGACPTSGTGAQTVDNTEIPPTTDDDSLTWSVTMESGQPGGSIHQIVRVGAAVLATVDSGDWTADSVNEGATVLTYDNLDVVGAMAVFRPREE